MRMMILLLLSLTGTAQAANLCYSTTPEQDAALQHLASAEGTTVPTFFRNIVGGLLDVKRQAYAQQETEGLARSMQDLTPEDKKAVRDLIEAKKPKR
jgi:hypothetical protein